MQVSDAGIFGCSYAEKNRKDMAIRRFTKFGIPKMAVSCLR